MFFISAVVNKSTDVTANTRTLIYHWQIQFIILDQTFSVNQKERYRYYFLKTFKSQAPNV